MVYKITIKNEHQSYILMGYYTVSSNGDVFVKDFVYKYNNVSIGSASTMLFEHTGYFVV